MSNVSLSCSCAAFIAHAGVKNSTMLIRLPPPVKHGRVGSLMVKKCPVSEPEWQNILESLFQQKPLSDIQATATVESFMSISITIRKQIQGITVCHAIIVLVHCGC